MADFLSHYLFGQEMLPLMPNAVSYAAKKYPSAFNWGLQGPDPLFFHALAFGSPFHAYGNRMHSEKTDALFYAFSRAVNRLNDERQIIAQAYFYGFLCHYALDSNLHPYVYCRQVQWKKKMPHANDSAIHCQIESDIDYALYKAKYKKPVTEFKVDDAYKMSETEAATLAVILHYLLKTVYDVDVQIKALRNAFDEMRKTEKLLYSKNQTVYKSLKQIEKVIGKGVLTSHFKVNEPDWDCMNLEHKPWFNLWQPNIIRSESVPEIFELAGKQAAKLTTQYSSELDAGWLLLHHFDVPFDNGNPKNRNGFKQLPAKL